VIEKELEGVDSDLIRGNIDTIILKALMSGDKYGYEIIKDIEHKSGGAYIIKQPTLYACLKRLEEQGFSKSYWGAKSMGGRKKYYTLTDMGRDVFAQSKSEWEHSKIVVDMLISDNEMAGFEVAKKEVLEIDNSPVVDKSSDTFFYGTNENQASFDIIQEPAIISEFETNSNIIHEPTVEETEAAIQSSADEADIYSNNAIEKDSMFSQLVENNKAGLDKIFSFDEEEDKKYENVKDDEAEKIYNNEENFEQIISDYQFGKSYASDIENTEYSPDDVGLNQQFSSYNDTDHEEELPFEKLPIEKQSTNQNVSIYYNSTNIYNNSHETNSTITSETTEKQCAPTQIENSDPTIELEQNAYTHPVQEELKQPLFTPYTSPDIAQHKPQNDYFSYSSAPKINMSDADIIRRDYRGVLEKLVKNNIKHKTAVVVVKSSQEQKLEKLQKTGEEVGESLIIRRHDETLQKYNAENYFYKNRLRLWHHAMMFVIMMVQIAVMLLVHSALRTVGTEFRRMDIWLYVLSVVVAFAVYPLVAVIFAARDYNARKVIKFDFRGSMLFRLIVVGCLWGVIFIVNILGVLTDNVGVINNNDFTQFLATLVLPSILVLNIFISLFLYKGFLDSGRFNVKN